MKKENAQRQRGVKNNGVWKMKSELWHEHDMKYERRRTTRQ